MEVFAAPDNPAAIVAGFLIFAPAAAVKIPAPISSIPEAALPVDILFLFASI